MAAYERAMKERRRTLGCEAAALRQWTASIKLSYSEIRENASELGNNAQIMGIFNDIAGVRDEIRRLAYAERYLVDLIEVEEAAAVIQDEQADIHAGISALEALQLKQQPVSYSPSLGIRIAEYLGVAKAAYLNRCMTALTVAANACQWPRAIEAARWDDGDVIGFIEAAESLVRLKDALGEDGRRALVKVLMAPVGIRFAFHFETDSPEGRSSDRPEWFLKYLERLAQEHAEFFAEYLDIMIASTKEARPFLDLFIDELVEMAKGRLVRLRPGLQDNSLLLSQAVGSIAAFYRGLRDSFGYEDEGQVCLALFTADEELMASWLEAETEALDRTFEGIDVLPYGPFVSQTIDLFDATTLLYRDIEDCSLQARFFCRLQVCLLERLYSKLEFSLPPFHSPREDLTLHLQAANAIDGLLEVMRACWSNDMFFIELAQSPEAQLALGYNAAALPGGLFNKALTAFSELLDEKILTEHVVGHVMGQFLQHASGYAKAMHYGISRHPGEHIDTHPGLQKGLIALQSAFEYLKSAGLLPHLLRFVETATVNQLAHFFFAKVILKNYFHIFGAEAFSRDLASTIQHLTGIFSVPLGNYFAKCQEAATLFQMPPSAVADLQAASIDALRLGAALKKHNLALLSSSETAEILRQRKP